MKYINRSGVKADKWEPSMGRWEYSSWSSGEFYVVLGAMQQVKVHEEVMS